MGSFGRDPFRERMEELLVDWDMLDINSQKGRYAWSNMRSGPGHIAAILDNFLIHNNFLNINSSIKSYILPSIIFDHKPISLHVHEILEYGLLPFRFKPSWINHHEVLSFVESSWVLGTPVFIWEQKLVTVKQGLKLWAKSSFNTPKKEKEVLKAKLDNFQKELEYIDITDQLQIEELDLQIRYQGDVRREEKLWRLKSRSLWLKDGDRNNKFFHNQAKVRESRNNVSNIGLEDGTQVSDFVSINAVAKSHFVDLFFEHEEAGPSNVASVLEHIPSFISNEENSTLTQPISEAEIFATIWSLGPDKVPGLDGFTISFYRHFWDLIKYDLKCMLHYSHQALRLGGKPALPFNP